MNTQTRVEQKLRVAFDTSIDDSHDSQKRLRKTRAQPRSRHQEGE
jgi:hypothetical protein